LDYVAIPDAVIKLVEKTWKSELKDTAGKPIW
jgi:phosphate transport system substrate-binding protein